MTKKNMNIKTIRHFSMFIFVVFFGCRGYIDTDFAVYFPLYENAPTVFDANGIAKYFSDINNVYCYFNRYIRPFYNSIFFWK